MSGRAHFAGAISILLLCFSSSLSSWSSQELPQNPPIRADVIRVNVGVNVTDSRGNSIKGLRPKDFRVFDDGVEQPITSFDSRGGPAQLVLLIEAGAQNSLLARIGKSSFVAADMLLSKAAPSTQIAIVTYSNHARVVLDFTSDRLVVRRALRDLHVQLLTSRTGSSSVNLSSSVAATINWLESAPGSKTIVLLSTGIDSSPQGSWEAVEQRLLTSDVRLLAVSILGDFRKLPKGRKLSFDDRENRAFVRQGIAEADQWLAQLCTKTGGRSYFPKDTDDFDRAFSQIGSFMDGEYSLGFVPPRLDDRIHSISVKVTKSGYRLHHRQAYIALSLRSAP